MKWQLAPECHAPAVEPLYEHFGGLAEQGADVARWVMFVWVAVLAGDDAVARGAHHRLDEVCVAQVGQTTLVEGQRNPHQVEQLLPPVLLEER